MINRVFIGVDEAGYGPNLGPLVVARSVWAVPQRLSEPQLTVQLADRFQPRPWVAGCKHVPLGDSKQLYQPAHSLRSLEAGLLAMLAQLGPIPSQLQQLLQLYSPRPFHSSGPVRETGDVTLPWYAADALNRLQVPAAPLSPAIADHPRLSTLARTALQRLDLELVDMQAVIVCEPDFNSELAHSGSKGTILADATMQLVLDATRRWPDAELHFFCDRQGGRKDYLPVLLRHMPDDWFQQLLATPQRSSYRRQREPLLDIHFTVGGDSFPPTALASMFAKYLRERLMQAFNTFWQQHLPQLVPTAGYPQDAKRYRAEIEGEAQRLGLSPAAWWRNK